jgi:predicted amidohydrolase YtcJ
MPVAQDLDRATTDHPVLVKRGGHNDVLNSFGMRLAGVTKETRAPDGGTIVMDENGNPNGWLIDAAIGQAERVYPTPDFESQVDSVRRACSDYAACGSRRSEMRSSNAKSGSCFNTLRSGAQAYGFVLCSESDSPAVQRTLPKKIDQWGMRSGFGDDRVRVQGLKLVLDGGAENGATEEPYENRSDFQGMLLWDTTEMLNVLTHTLRSGCKVGIHAWSDRAVLDAFKQVIRALPDVRQGTLILEHGGFANAEQRTRTIQMRIPVSVQHPQLYSLAPLLIPPYNLENMPTSSAFEAIRLWCRLMRSLPFAQRSR